MSEQLENTNVTVDINATPAQTVRTPSVRTSSNQANAAAASRGKANTSGKRIAYLCVYSHT
jgi:hypothetical protein